jgi:hypothetical protein
MKNLIILMMMLVSYMGYSQLSKIDSTEVYRVMPWGDKLLTIYEFEYAGTHMDSLYEVYNQKRFVVKIYYQDDSNEQGESTGEYRQRVYTSTWSKKD